MKYPSRNEATGSGGEDLPSSGFQFPKHGKFQEGWGCLEEIGERRVVEEEIEGIRSRGHLGAMLPM